MKWLINRLHEASTWRGIIWLLTAFGLTLKPDESEAIIVAGVALAGLFGVFTDDEPHQPNQIPPINLQGRLESTNSTLDTSSARSNYVSAGYSVPGCLVATDKRMQSGVQSESKTEH